MHEMVLYQKLHARLAKKNIGAAPATCTKATAIGFAERLVINHPAPTSCIHVPMFDSMLLIHNQRKAE